MDEYTVLIVPRYLLQKLNMKPTDLDFAFLFPGEIITVRQKDSNDRVSLSGELLTTWQENPDNETSRRF
ncbi:MAG: hypothetical protein Q4F61_00065 [Candidatus Saccharibacteria bacterium]|nr:hypothetical protein [Candidatus Saccharibacteria bacterium]